MIVRAVNGALGTAATPSWQWEFRALWWAEAISLVGDQLTRVAISVLVFQRTSSAWLTALTYAMTYVPDAVGGLLLSGVADRIPRRELMAGICTLQAGLITSIALPNLPTWLVALLVASSAILLAPYRAAQGASVRVVARSGDDKDQAYSVANSKMTLMRETGQLVGLAGAGVAISALGVTTALLVDAASFLLAAVLIAVGLRHRSAAHGRGPRSPWRPDQRQLPLIGFILLCSLTVLPFGLVAPLVAELHAPPWGTGLLLAADPAGFVIIGKLVERYVPVATQQRCMGFLACVSLGALIPLAVVDHWVIAAGLLFVSGGSAYYTITAKTALMSPIPDHQSGFAYGRVRAALRASQGAAVLVGGWTARELGSATHAIAAAGAVGVVLGFANEIVWRRRNTMFAAGTTRA